ncbi:hypothetical protein A3G06_00570 [Candidatus Nomurabacteria bacterium RIFCSPLOWO2_12_FULL_46_14]|uniref:Glutamate/phenylalanine/leucine/valine/L-tryptophan dehydrogenase C-terminal domain-containing protein n=1 Tax=Candidatus Nomurabacteria bacterium RIFCSPLOWO2_12_FULL_46_14 TaxID=1801797 RepID=A0A1F6Y9P7_9BACT|nr:MAG: hypothetical protein A3G06_00570 [Candidatus Nomurabacteria bacterium RIFCSPLOWO2_12_FULL_46_14]
MTKIRLLNPKKYPRHEQVYSFEDKAVGLRGYIAIHNTSLGPATGGTRLYPYNNDAEALEDVLKLSEAMTYKCAFAGLPFGGGKAVIMASPQQKTKELLKSYAKVIHFFGGKYTTGTDVGISDEDAKYMSTLTPFILRGTRGRTSTSLVAARGVYESITASFRELLPKKKLSAMTIAIKGAGKIGAELIRLLYSREARITIAEINPAILSKIKKLFPKIKTADYKNIHKLKADIFSPCAMGGDLNKKTIKELGCRIIAGGANNQLEDEKDIVSMHRQGVWYIPDYVANAGGLIQIVDELRKGGYKSERVKKNIKNIGRSTTRLIQESKRTGLPPLEIAGNIVRARMHQ